MFCSKCGTQNPDNGKFCRTCGTDIGTAAIAPLADRHELATDNSRADMYAEAIRRIIFGMGFICISIALFITGVAGGRSWWWAMLFPAVAFLAKGISEYVRAEKLGSVHPATSNELPGRASLNVLPPKQTEFVAPDHRYKTGDLVPPSVTDATTRHLELDSEGEPKK